MVVNNVAPSFPLQSNATLLLSDAGVFDRTISFTDPGSLDVHTVKVDWNGDTIVDETLAVSPAGAHPSP